MIKIKLGCLFALTLLVLLIFPTYATSPIYCPPDNNTEQINNIIHQWYSSHAVDGFSVYDYHFCAKYSHGNIEFIAQNISQLGLTYSLYAPISINIDNNTVTSTVQDSQQIKNYINQFESKKEVKDFVTFFNIEVDKKISLYSFDIRAGDNYLEYDYKKDEFARYSLPINMSNNFPALLTYKDEVEAAGCQLNDSNPISYVKNEYWNTITINSKVDGNCKRSNKYMGGKVYEIEYPIDTGIWIRIKIWFRQLTH